MMHVTLDCAWLSRTTKVTQCVPKCQNDSNFLQRAVESEEFHKILDYAIQCRPNATINVKKLSTRHAMSNEQKMSFREMYEAVSRAIKAVAKAYKKLCGYEIPFLCICHDLWSGKRKELLGVTAVYLDPNYDGILYKLPIGLVPSDGKDSKTTAEQTLSILKTYGIEKNWLFRGINDNTASAVKSTKLLMSSDETGYCLMHKVELCIKHSLGLLKRSHNNEVTDSFKEGEKLVELGVKFAKELQNARMKSRYEQ